MCGCRFVLLRGISKDLNMVSKQKINEVAYSEVLWSQLFKINDVVS